MVHACVFSHLDYCNSVLGAISEKQLNTLQKIQNAAVRFILGIKGKDYRLSITPFLKQLHFLPVRYRIIYKIALLTFKGYRGMAPKYISEMIQPRVPKTSYPLRTNADEHLLELRSPHPNLKKTEGAFCVIAPKIWNNLPHYVRSQAELPRFKKVLKTHLFEQAYMNNE